MSITIQAKNDVSYLFSSLGSGAAGVVGSNWLSDYTSIKNGSYGKLMKAYFKEASSDDTKTASTASKKDTAKATAAAKYSSVQKSADALRSSAEAVTNQKLYAEKEIKTKDENGVETVTKGYDTDAIYKAVNSFVNDYNSVVGATADLTDKTLGNRMTYLNRLTMNKQKDLSELGISIESDGTLKLDKDTFMKADMSKAKRLFATDGGYGSRMSSQASLIKSAAGSAANRSGGYTAKASYNTAFTNGNLFSTYL